jgi:hypothetical protein
VSRLGGDNAHAAVAIMLDVNKHVVFARNVRGRFVARQVVAISDDGIGLLRRLRQS